MRLLHAGVEGGGASDKVEVEPCNADFTRRLRLALKSRSPLRARWIVDRRMAQFTCSPHWAWNLDADLPFRSFVPLMADPRLDCIDRSGLSLVLLLARTLFHPTLTLSAAFVARFSVVTLSASRACRSGQVARLVLYGLYGCLHVRGLAPCRPRPWLWCRCVAARVAGLVARGCPGCLIRVLRSPIFQLYAVLVRPLGAHSALLKGLRVWVASWLPFVSRVLVDST